jgi:replicative DNA helicase
VSAVTLAEATSRSLSEQDSVPTGFLDLDNLIGGLGPGQLIAIGAGPGVGKSAFVFNLAWNAVNGTAHAALLVSLEHTCAQVAKRLLAAESRENAHKLGNRNLGQEAPAAAARILSAAKLSIADAPRQEVMRIAANARQLHKEKVIRAVFVDCLDLIEPRNPREFRPDQIANICKGLRFLARELAVPVVATARIGREADSRQDRRPRLSDLRSVEQDADTVMFLHRPELYEPGQHEGVIELIVAKQRNGPTGEIQLTFLKQFMRFENFAVEQPFGSEI